MAQNIEGAYGDHADQHCRTLLFMCMATPLTIRAAQARLDHIRPRSSPPGGASRTGQGGHGPEDNQHEPAHPCGRGRAALATLLRVKSRKEGLSVAEAHDGEEAACALRANADAVLTRLDDAEGIRDRDLPQILPHAAVEAPLRESC